MIPADGRGLNQERAKGTRSDLPYELFAAVCLCLPTQVLFCTLLFPRAVGEDEQHGGLAIWEVGWGKIELPSSKPQDTVLAGESQDPEV